MINKIIKNPQIKKFRQIFSKIVGIADLLIENRKRKERLFDELCDATFEGDIGKVKELVKVGVDIENKDYFGMTPLNIAIEKKHTEIAKYFIEEVKVKVNAVGRNGNTPLLCATKEHPEMVEYLVGVGARVNIRSRNGITPLHIAAQYNTKALKVLVENKAKLNVRNIIGDTPLHNAAWHNTEGLKVLIKNKAKLNVRNIRGETPLHNATWGNTEALKVLIKNKAKLNVQDKNGETPLFITLYRRIEQLKVFVEAGADVNIINKRGETPLDIAYENFRFEERLEEKKERKEIINFLKKAGAKTSRALREEKQNIPQKLKNRFSVLFLKAGDTCDDGNKHHSR